MLRGIARVTLARACTCGACSALRSDPSDARAALVVCAATRKRRSLTRADVQRAFDAAAGCLEHWPFGWSDVAALAPAAGAAVCELWEALGALLGRGAAPGGDRAWWPALFATAWGSLRNVPAAAAPSAGAAVLRARLLAAQAPVCDALCGPDNGFSPAARAASHE